MTMNVGFFILRRLLPSSILFLSLVIVGFRTAVQANQQLQQQPPQRQINVDPVLSEADVNYDPSWHHHWTGLRASSPERLPTSTPAQTNDDEELPRIVCPEVPTTLV